MREIWKGGQLLYHKNRDSFVGVEESPKKDVNYLDDVLKVVVHLYQI